MAVVAQSGTPIDVSYTNALPFTYPSWIPVDTRLTPLGNQLRVMTHLHGAVVAGTSDGTPSVMPNGFGSGDTQTVHYPNEQPATLLWFHDHALGATRLNVFAGLAAGEHNSIAVVRPLYFRWRRGAEESGSCGPEISNHVDPTGNEMGRLPRCAPTWGQMHHDRS
jgi:Multicopper oxidase